MNALKPALHVTLVGGIALFFCAQTASVAPLEAGFTNPPDVVR